MQTLPKDVVEKISNELTPQELVVFMDSELPPGVNKIFDSNDFWWRRLRRDFYFLYSYIRKHNIEINPKNAYLKIFSEISKNAENIENLFLIRYNYSSKTLYKILYDISFSLIERVINEEAFSKEKIKRIVEESNFYNFIPEGLFLDIKLIKEKTNLLFYEIITNFLGIEIESEVPFTGWGF